MSRRLSDRPRRNQKPKQAFTPEVQAKFLELYAASHCFIKSAEGAGVSDETVRLHLKSDPDFAEDFKKSEQKYRELIYNEVQRRGIEGWVEPRFNANGKMVGGVRKFSDQLLTMLAKRHDHAFRDKLTVESNVVSRIEVPVDLRKLSPAAREALRQIAEEQARVAGLNRTDGDSAEVQASSNAADEDETEVPG